MKNTLSSKLGLLWWWLYEKLAESFVGCVMFPKILYLFYMKAFCVICHKQREFKNTKEITTKMKDTQWLGCVVLAKLRCIVCKKKLKYIIRKDIIDLTKMVAKDKPEKTLCQDIIKTLLLI